MEFEIFFHYTFETFFLDYGKCISFWEMAGNPVVGTPVHMDGGLIYNSLPDALSKLNHSIESQNENLL